MSDYLEFKEKYNIIDNNNYDKHTISILNEIVKGNFNNIHTDTNGIFYNCVALYYKYKGNKEEAKKYYLMAVKNGHFCAISNLASLYEEENNMEEAKKYYLMAAKKR